MIRHRASDEPDGEAPRTEPAWPARLREILLSIGVGGGVDAHRQAQRAEAWVLINSGLRRYVRMHATGRRLEPEDIEDIASTKALDLIRRAESGEWQVRDRAPAEVAAYLSTIARNALVDLARRERLFVRSEGSSEDELDRDANALQHSMPGTTAADLPIDRARYAALLRCCIESLQPRARRIWLFRVLHDMPTRDIASHPDVSLKPAHVDVVLQRCRDTIRECVATRGYDPHEMPPGTVAELWDHFAGDADPGAEYRGSPRAPRGIRGPHGDQRD
ncbi:MAG: sigma-70 family RNA polymerase sigma factor [bacterium]